MPIYISDKPEVNVVNIGDELTQNQLNAITNAGAAWSPVSSSNPFVTKTRFFNTQLVDFTGVSTVTMTPVDFANLWDVDVVTQTLYNSGHGWFPIKITISLEGPAQGISSPTIEFNIYNGDKSNVQNSTATLVANNIQTGSGGRYTISPISGGIPRYEWVFEYTPIQMAGSRCIYPNISLATSNGSSGNWQFAMTLEATAN
jgi:hypothetical protein